jgi:hypothetical protein
MSVLLPELLSAALHLMWERCTLSEDEAIRGAEWSRLRVGRRLARSQGSGAWRDS